jgi:hypothetical protein
MDCVIGLFCWAHITGTFAHVPAEITDSLAQPFTGTDILAQPFTDTTDSLAQQLMRYYFKVFWNVQSGESIFTSEL